MRDLDNDAPWLVVNDEAEWYQPAPVEHEHVTGRVGLHRRYATDGPAPGVNHVGADELVDPKGVLVSDRLGVERGVAKSIGLIPTADPAEGDNPAVLVATGPFDAQVAALPMQDRAGIQALDPVGDQLDDDLAAQPVGLDDPADLEQTQPLRGRLGRPARLRRLSRRCRR